MSDLTPMALVVLLVAAVILAAGAVLLLIPRAMPFFMRYAMSRPNARSSHRIPTPQGGGAPVAGVVIAIVAGAAMTGLVPMQAGIHPFYMLAMAASFAMALLGAADDMRPLPATGRLALQAGLTAIVVFGAPEDWRLVDALPIEIERAIAVVAGVWFVNLTNFMDGIDWIVVAEFVPVTLTLSILAMVDVISPLGGLAAAALCGALLGFAPFNRHPARLFLGDVGSLPIGLIAATILFELATRGHVAAALLLPMYFLFDATETLLRGLIARQNVLAAHRRHAYQNAVDAGVSVHLVTARVFALSMLLAVLALCSVVATSPVLDAVLVLIGLNATILLSHRFRQGRA